MTARRRQLHYLVTVAEEGQITSAARKLHLAQPALSQAIAQLEAELGIELLERHPRGVTLTPAGETFLVKARRALAAEIDAAQTAQALARAARGAIAIGFVGRETQAGIHALTRTLYTKTGIQHGGFSNIASRTWRRTTTLHRSRASTPGT